jgi:hypothetical protein
MYSLKSKPTERDNLLAIIYSPVLYLQNNFSIDFFDIWIDEIYIHQESKVNKFLAKNNIKSRPALQAVKVSTKNNLNLNPLFQKVP